MAKMTKAQRTAILDAHNYPGQKLRGLIMANKRTVAVLKREGWATRWIDDESAWLTTAGLLAAGVDMHADAAAENEMRDAAAAQATPAYRRFCEATRQGGSYRDALDILHAEARREDSRRRVAAAVQGHPEALEGTLGGPEMVLAVLPLAIEQAHGEALAENEDRAHERVADLGVHTPAASAEIAQAYANLERAREMLGEADDRSGGWGQPDGMLSCGDGEI